MPREWNDLAGIRASLGPDVERAVRAALERLANPGAEVAALLEQGRIDAALDALPWTDAMTALERRMYRLALLIQARAAREAQARTPTLRYRFDLTNPRAIRAAQQQAGDLVREVTVDTRLAIRDIVVRGQRDGVDVREQGKLIRQHVGLTRRQATAVYNFRRNLVDSGAASERIDRLVQRRHDRAIRLRAQTIARTETIRASNAGQQELWRQARQQGVIPANARRVWVASPDACDFCKPMDGQVAGLEENFQSGRTRGSNGQLRSLNPVLTPPVHPSCCPGDTVVASRYRVAGQSERWYEGELVVIRTAAGHKLSCTPNHPVLTDHGWVAAGLLHEDDHVFCDVAFQGMGSGNQDYELMPTRIEQVASALGQAFKVTAHEVPVAPEDFHGDGTGSEVAVVRSYGLLRNRDQAVLGQPIVDDAFIEAHAPQSLAPGRPPAQSIVRLPRTAHGTVGGSNLRGTLFVGHASPFDALGLAARTGRNAAPEQALDDGGATHPPDARELQNRFPGKVVPDKVIQVERDVIASHVYNLQTDDGWYIAGGLLVQNCRCSLSLEIAA